MDRSLVRHAHPHCHVLLKIDGDDTQFAVGEHMAPLTDGLAVLINAWETHAYLHDPVRRNTLILALYIEPAWLRLFRANWIASGAPGFFESSTGIVHPRIRRIAHDLVDEMIEEPSDSPTKEALLSELMIAVISSFTPWQQPAPTRWQTALRSNPDRRIARALAAMQQAEATPPPVAALARTAGLSRAHFFRLFEQSIGVTPHVFLNVLRIERAVRRVAGSEDRLVAIGESLGFESSAQFSRFFRDHVSVSPREFRTVLGNPV